MMENVNINGKKLDNTKKNQNKMYI